MAAVMRVARAHKARDATGLGLLAYAFAKGDASVLNQSMDDRSVKLIAKAIRHPVDFWEWVSAQSADQKCRVLVANAGRYREGGRPHDKAVVQAAAFLAVSSPLPDPTPAPAADAPFPHWVVFDRHTSEGKRALRDVARDLHIPLPQLEWCFYYFEGAAANAEAALAVVAALLPMALRAGGDAGGGGASYAGGRHSGGARPMTIDAYEPERTVEELLQQLCDQADDQPLVATVCDDGWYTYRPRLICHAGDVRWLCEEVLRLRQAPVRPRKLVIFNGGSLHNKVGVARVSDDQGTLEVPIENHAGRVTHTEQVPPAPHLPQPRGKT